MRRSLAPDPLRLAVALLAGLTVFFAASPFATVLTLTAAALLGLALEGSPRSAIRPNQDAPARPPAPAILHLPFSRAQSLIAAAIFLALLLLLPPLAAITASPLLVRFNDFYRAGALVFGGGHVVLPLLERAVVDPGWVDPRSFLAGYGMAQAVPGPLFTFAAYLGAVLKDPATNAPHFTLAARAANSALALAAIFLPGLLLMAAALPFWATLGQNHRLRAALRAVNASVVGILFAALIRPVATTAFQASTHP
jgi:chromate transporter